jgi:hypothetical protein
MMPLGLSQTLISVRQTKPMLVALALCQPLQLISPLQSYNGQGYPQVQSQC